MAFAPREDSKVLAAVEARSTRNLGHLPGAAVFFGFLGALLPTVGKGLVARCSDMGKSWNRVLGGMAVKAQKCICRKGEWLDGQCARRQLLEQAICVLIDSVAIVCFLLAAGLLVRAVAAAQRASRTLSELTPEQRKLWGMPEGTEEGNQAGGQDLTPLFKQPQRTRELGPEDRPSFPNPFGAEGQRSHGRGRGGFGGVHEGSGALLAPNANYSAAETPVHQLDPIPSQPLQAEEKMQPYTPATAGSRTSGARFQANSPLQVQSEGDASGHASSYQEQPVRSFVFDGSPQAARDLSGWAPKGGQGDEQHYELSPPEMSKKSPREKGEASSLAANETFDGALSRLRPGMDRITLSDRVREWLSASVFKKLLHKLQIAHELAAGACKELLDQEVKLTPLLYPEKIDPEEEPLLEEVKQKLASFNSNKASASLNQIDTYLRLLSLLRGDHPRGLMPNVPPGYIVHRVRQLAEGTCLHSFRWDGGGEWDGERWSAELPDDSQLVLYLVCSFLEWWNIEAERRHVKPGSSGPLYLSNLPSRPPDRYHAVLPSRPHSLQPEATVLVFPRSSPPEFHLVLKGSTAVHLTGRHAVFEALALFFLNADDQGHGTLGSLRLRSQALGLDHVLDAE